MSKKAKKQATWSAKWRRRFVALDKARARAKLAIVDDGGIEKAIRKVWSWANALLPGQDDVGTKGSLQKLQIKMGEALDVLATLTGAALEQFPAPALTSRASPEPAQMSKERSDAVARELLKDPAVRRGFEAEQKRFKDGTRGLTDEQRELARRMGVTDRETLAKLSAAMSTRSATPGARSSSTFTAEQLRVAARLGIKMTDLDPAKVKAHANAMRTGAGVELESRKN